MEAHLGYLHKKGSLNYSDVLTKQNEPRGLGRDLERAVPSSLNLLSGFVPPFFSPSSPVSEPARTDTASWSRASPLGLRQNADWIMPPWEPRLKGRSQGPPWLQGEGRLGRG